MRILKFALLLAIAELITPILCLGQSRAIENKTGSAQVATPINDSVVSVQELEMSGKAESAFKKGTQLLQKGDARGSVTYFKRALAKDPGYYRAYHNLGLAQYRLGEIAQAEEALQRAIDLTNGGFAPSQFVLGMILVEKQQFREAETVIQRGLDMEPGSALGKYFLGLAQFALNQLSDAERSAHDALFRSADQADAHILLAMIHELDHNPYAVEADIAAYLKLQGHGPLENEANILLQRAQKEIRQKAYSNR
jgi:Tfp pilus assembly protein PilF